MTIRAIETHECEEAKRLMASCFPSSYFSIFFLDPSSTLVAIEEGRIVGGINLLVYRTGKLLVGYVGWVYVSDTMRGKGIAKKLYAHAFSFLKAKGCTDILLCIEGDNPASFALVAGNEEFTIMSAPAQLRRFGLGLLKVNRYASRFFDMGYFLWHRECGQKRTADPLNPSQTHTALSLLATLLISMLFALPLALFGRIAYVSILASACMIALRSLILKAFLGKSIFLSWDTAYFPAIISLVLPFRFPVPGGIYPKGKEWKMNKKMIHKLGIASIASIAGELLLLFIWPERAAALRLLLPLLLLDTLFPFYPFCGFLASRVKRALGSKGYLFFAFCILALVSLFLFTC